MDDELRRCIEWECQKQSIAYARYVDYKEYDKFVQLFAPDGELNITGTPIVGREKLTKAMEIRPDSAMTVREGDIHDDKRLGESRNF